MKFQSSMLRVVILIFAAIGLLAVIAVVGMALMHFSMGGMMQGTGMGHMMGSMCRAT